MLKRILFILVSGLFIFSLSISADDSQSCKLRPPDSGPGKDSGDDNMSLSDGNSNRFYFITPDILVFEEGYYEVYENPDYGEKENAFTDLKDSAEVLLNSGRTIIFPSGSLFGKDKDTTLKIVLEAYVRAGGVIIAFGQQDSGDYNVLPVPQGESLKAYGWRGDQSCLKNSVYFDSIHPVVSSSGSQRVDVGVDGYFADYPANTTILLQRVTSREPVLIMYNYFSGKVILTSMFSDWSYAHSGASVAELNIVRDLVSYCKAHAPIPLFDLSKHPAPGINLNVNVKNNSEETATRMVLKVLTPNRERVLYEIEQNISLTPGAEMEVPVTFTLPEVTPSEHGIFLTCYELYNTEGTACQLFTESTTGFFTVYKITKSYTPSRNYSVWV